MMKQLHFAPYAVLSLFAGFLMALIFALPANSAEMETTPPGTAIEQVALKQNVIVSNATILIGDLFEGAGDKAAIAVAYSPEPGKRGIFDANWLYRVANAYGLKWRPLSLKQQVIVTRDAIIIEREEIEDHILAALIDTGVDPEMTASLSNRAMRLYIPTSSEAVLSVQNVSYDDRTHRFSAFISTPGSRTVRVSGRLSRMINLPVLNRRMLKNEIIRSEDIKWIRTPSERMQPDVVMHVEDLVGKTPKRGLREGFPIRTADIRRPILVEKGSLVTMILKTPLMTLTSQGRAVENGSDGDVIRITNTQSRKVVQAVVTGSGIAAITPASHLAMN